MSVRSGSGFNSIEWQVSFDWQDNLYFFSIRDNSLRLISNCLSMLANNVICFPMSTDQVKSHYSAARAATNYHVSASVYSIVS